MTQILKRRAPAIAENAGGARVYLGHLRLEEKEHEVLKKIATSQRRTIAEVCRWAIREFLAAKNGGKA